MSALFRLVGMPLNAKSFIESVPKPYFGAKFTYVASRVLTRVDPALLEAAKTKKEEGLFEQLKAVEAHYRANRPSIGCFKKLNSMNALMLFHYWHGFGRTIYAIEQKLENFFGKNPLHRRLDEINKKLDDINELLKKPDGFNQAIKSAHDLTNTGQNTLHQLVQITNAESKKAEEIRKRLDEIVNIAKEIQQEKKEDTSINQKLQQTIDKSESIIKAQKLEMSTKEVLKQIEQHLNQLQKETDYY